MTPFPDLMRQLDEHLSGAMHKAADTASRGRYVEALLERSERLYAQVFGHDLACARHAGASRRAAERATAAKGRCRK